MRNARVTTLAAVVVLGLAGCADEAADTDDGVLEEPIDETEDPAGGVTEPTATEMMTEPAGTETATEGDAAAAEGPTVIVENIAFQDQSVTVEAGTPVTWDNQDSVAHTVTSGTPGSPTGVFDEDLPGGDQVSITVDEPGTYQYFCEIHPTMTAELVVEAAG